MIDFLGSLWWMIVALGVLVTFHEFGHYWVARRCGVRVLKFSVGFGKTLFSRRDKHGTEFAISAIPLGGYVKMLDEHASDSPIPAEQLHESFNRKPVLQRMAIVAAGPAANLLLCVLFLWAMLIIGKQDWSATLGQIQGIAAQAGFERGERILEVDGRKTSTWGEASLALTAAAIDREDVPVTVEDGAGHSTQRVLPLSQLPKGFDQENVVALAGLGWAFQSVPAQVGEVVADGPADGRLQPGDQIIAVNGRTVHDLADLRGEVARLGERGGSGMVEVDRAGERFAFELTPQRLKQADGSPYWALGIAAAATGIPEQDALLRYGPLAAIPMAIRETGQMASDSLGMIRRMLVGDASVKNISGPITIARAANSSAKRGAAWFLWFLAAVSLSLAIVNLLPIPVLDGGHLLYYLIELVKGSPLSERSLQAGQYVGLLMLAGLMGLAFYNDIFRLVGG